MKNRFTFLEMIGNQTKFLINGAWFGCEVTHNGYRITRNGIEYCICKTWDRVVSILEKENQE